MENTKVRAKLPIIILSLLTLALACLAFFAPISNGEHYKLRWIDFVFNNFYSVVSSIISSIFLLLYCLLPHSNKKNFALLIAFAMNLAVVIAYVIMAGVEYIMSQSVMIFIVFYAIIGIFGALTILKGNHSNTLKITWMVATALLTVIIAVSLYISICGNHYRTATMELVEIINNVAMFLFALKNKCEPMIALHNNTKVGYHQNDGYKLKGKIPLIILCALGLGSVVLYWIGFDKQIPTPTTLELFCDDWSYGATGVIPNSVCYLLLLTYCFVPQQYKWKSILIVITYALTALPSLLSLVLDTQLDEDVMVIFLIAFAFLLFNAFTGHKLKVLNTISIILMTFLLIMFSVGLLEELPKTPLRINTMSAVTDVPKIIALFLLAITNKIHPIIAVSKKQERAFTDDWEYDPETGTKVKRER